MNLFSRLDGLWYSDQFGVRGLERYSQHQHQDSYKWRIRIIRGTDPGLAEGETATVFPIQFFVSLIGHVLCLLLLVLISRKMNYCCTKRDQANSPGDIEKPEETYL